MKISLLLLVFIKISAFSDNYLFSQETIVSGRINDLKSDTVLLINSSTFALEQKVVSIADSFYIKVDLKETGRYFIRINQITIPIIIIPRTNLYIQADNVNIRNVRFEGYSANENILYNNFNKLNNENYSTLSAYNDSLNKFKNINNTQKTSYYSKLLLEAKIKEQNNAFAFINTNPKSFTALFLVNVYRNYMEVTAIKHAFKALKKWKKHSLYKSVEKTLTLLSKARKGKLFPQKKLTYFSTGKTFKISNIKTKLLLIDFWGSWCGPCIKSIPELHSLSDKYKSSGLTILSIAYDDTSKRHLVKKIIQEYQMDWLHAFEVKTNKKNNAIEKYGLTIFPTYILLDDKKRIILKLNGNEKFDSLTKKNEEILK